MFFFEKMALYARATSIFIVSNKCYLTLISPIVKSVSNNSSPAKLTFCAHSIFNLRFAHSDATENSRSQAFITFDNFVCQRRSDAKRSILVEVQSRDSTRHLYSYLSRFGNINCMYFYTLPDKENYVFVEFQELSTVNQILESSTHEKFDEVIPVKSPLLYFRKDRLKLKTFPISKVPVAFAKNNLNLKNFLDNLSNSKSTSHQMRKCYSLLKLDDLGLKLRFFTAHQVEHCFMGMFPKMEILPFGSTVNGFGKMDCDLDLYLNFDRSNMSRVQNNLVFQSKRVQKSGRIQSTDFLRIIGDTLDIFVPGICNVLKILKARVPIIKFNHRFAGVQCDLSISNMSAIYMSELLYLYGEIDTRVKPVVFVIRKWAQVRGITSNNPGGFITNFSLTLLILFYLQQKQVLPTLLQMQDQALKNDLRITDTNIDCTFIRDITKLRKSYPPEESPYVLLRGFFEFYSNFNFKEFALCLKEGKMLSKRDNSPLYIYNPLEPSLNVSRNVTVRELANIRTNFCDALWQLENASEQPDSKVWGICTLFNPVNQNISLNRRVNIVEIINEKVDTDTKANFVSVSE